MTDNTTLQQSLQEAQTYLETVQDAIRFAITQFNKHDLFYGHGTENGLDDAVALVLSSLHLTPDLDAGYFECKLLPHEKKYIIEQIAKRIETREPVPYLISQTYFGGFSFYVDKRVLIPRSPIAELLEEELSPWIEADKIERILDLGTGSACIALVAAMYFPDALVDAVDISPDALAVAQINLDKYELQDQVRLIQSDLFTNLKKEEKYDVIIANPPYVPTSSVQALPAEYHHEPVLALDGGEDGLLLVDRILAQASEFLTPGGILIMEVGEAQVNLEEKYPTIPFTWLQFARGGDGVFLLTAQELKEHEHLFKEQIKS